MLSVLITIGRNEGKYGKGLGASILEKKLGLGTHRLHNSGIVD